MVNDKNWLGFGWLEELVDGGWLEELVDGGFIKFVIVEECV